MTESCQGVFKRCWSWQNCTEKMLMTLNTNYKLNVRPHNFLLSQAKKAQFICKEEILCLCVCAMLFQAHGKG